MTNIHSSYQPRRMHGNPQNNRARKCSDARRGAVTVEFAICASLFFMIAFAGLEFGRYFYVQHGVQMIAYESARAGIVPGADRSDVETRANTLLEATGIPNATVLVTPQTITTQTRDVTVRVTCNFNDNSWVPPTFLTNKVIVSEIQLQHENNAYLDPDDVDIESLIGNNDNEPIDL